MSRTEILNAGALRTDGRRPLELRSFTAKLATHPTADGSASVAHGLTSVTACVYGPREARNRALTAHDRAIVNVEVSVAPFSAPERRKRARGDKRMLEFAAAIGSTFEPVIQTQLYPRSEIDIFVNVLQQDGGLLQASINACTLALIDAGIPLLDYVCATTSGLVSTTPLLDLTTLEESDLPYLTLAVLPRSGNVTLASMETRLHVDRFEEILRLGVEAGRALHVEMDRVVRERTTLLARQMAGETKAAGADDDDKMDMDG